MKKVIFTFLFIIIGCVLFAQANDAQIRQAATTLGVPFEDLKQFVQSYQAQLVPSGVIEITAKELYEAFKANELQADNKYKGKAVKVTGKVIQVKKDLYNKYYIEIEGTSVYHKVRAYVQDSQLSRISNLMGGQTVTVVGQCDGYFALDVYISNSVIQN